MNIFENKNEFFVWRCNFRRHQSTPLRLHDKRVYLPNLKYIQLPDITEALSLNLISPIGTLLLQQLGQNARSYLNPLLSEIDKEIEIFLLGN